MSMNSENHNTEELIELFQLQPLPMEGGYYRETYRSKDVVEGKSVSTAIYYLLTPETCSILHRLPSDEVYHFYLGDAVEMLLLSPDGEGQIIELGPNIRSGQRVQMVVPANTWQGSRLIKPGTFALMGTTMAPGFEFSDFEPAQRDALIPGYPQFAEQIRLLTQP